MKILQNIELGSLNMEKEQEKTINFVKRLKKLRIDKEYSQKDIAKLIGVNHVNYGRYERGLSRPSANTLTKLADSLDVSADYLLEGQEQDAVVADFEDKELLKLFGRLEKLPRDEKEKIKDIIDAFLMKKEIQDKYAS